MSSCINPDLQEKVVDGRKRLVCVNCDYSVPMLEEEDAVDDI